MHQIWYGNAKMSSQRIVKPASPDFFVQEQHHIDHGWLEMEKQKQLRAGFYNWNHQIGAVVNFIEELKDQRNGYDSEMLDHVAACVHIVLGHVKCQTNGPCMADFQQGIAPTKYNLETHKYQFDEFKKSWPGLQDVNWGAFGA